MKKIASILLLLFTGALALVHAAVPHTHHHRIFSLAVDLLDEHAKEKFDHHANFGIQQGYSDYLLLPVYQVELPTDDHVQLQTDWDFQSVSAIENVPPDIRVFFHLLPITQKPYTAFSHTAFVANSCGLRAPPFC